MTFSAFNPGSARAMAHPSPHPFIKAAALFLSALSLLLLSAIPCLAEAGATLEAAQTAGAEGQARPSPPSPLYSASYSPYRSYEILSEVAGRITAWGADEGEILPAGSPLLEIEHEALDIESEQLEKKLHLLLEEERNLRRILALKEKKLDRYRRLLKEGHLQPQAVEDVEVELLSFRMQLIQNRKQQADTERALAKVRDQLEKSMPSFDKPLYLSQRYKERFENVLPGQPVARLLDLSRARLHLVLPPEEFKLMEAGAGAELSFSLITPEGRRLHLKGRIERLKVDRDNDYLYSYGLDLIIPPQKGLLWGEVVKVGLSGRGKQPGQ